MLYTGRQQIDSGGCQAGVTQHIRQPDDILIGSIKGPGEEMPQVVGKYLSRWDIYLFTKPLHLCPDLTSGKPFSVSGEEYLARDDSLLFGILLQLPAQLAGD